MTKHMTKKEAIQYLKDCGPPLGFNEGDLIDDFNFLCEKKIAAGEKLTGDAYLDIANYLLEPE